MSSNQNTPRNNPFASVFDDLQPGQLQSRPKPVASEKATPSSEDIQKVAQEAAKEQGYARPVKVVPTEKSQPVKRAKAKPKKPEMVQFSVRAKADVIEQFRALLEAQEPKWSLGYGLERAVKALDKELEGS